MKTVEQVTTVKARVLKADGDLYVLEIQVGDRRSEQTVRLGDYVDIKLRVKYSPMEWV